jgi:hypothetical protein
MSYPISGLPHVILFSGGMFITVLVSRLISGRSLRSALYEACTSAVGFFVMGFLLTLFIPGF